MKRKAMLMGMAVMTSMPGWAMATSSSKAASGVQPYSRSLEAPVTLSSVTYSSMARDGRAAASPGKASELLAQMKSMLSNVNYGVSTQPTADNQGWKVKLLDNNDWVLYNVDPRLPQNKPIGVTFRLEF